LTAAYELGYRKVELYRKMGKKGFEILRKEHE